MKCKNCGTEYKDIPVSGFYTIMDNQLVKCTNCIQKEIDSIPSTGGTIKF